MQIDPKAIKVHVNVDTTELEKAIAMVKELQDVNRPEFSGRPHALAQAEFALLRGRVDLADGWLRLAESGRG